MPGRRRPEAVHRRAGHHRPRVLADLAGEDRPPGRHRPIADLVEDPELRAEVQLAIDDANKAVSKAESIRKFTILPDDWTETGGQLTPSLKLKRNVVHKEAAEQIEALYRGGRQD